jgi:hypothetical protein
MDESKLPPTTGMLYELVRPRRFGTSRLLSPAGTPILVLGVVESSDYFTRDGIYLLNVLVEGVHRHVYINMSDLRPFGSSQ